ncbi:NAD-dependent epimerase/dehydratase family protein [Bacillus sp. V5-8f]|uniref:NAD-dependent epimerase/dehydratase family protein n=1 Tax=Bacillus sp. V5-8f TaxID=2053044 RepID=UPI0015E0811E|nr:NAD-dependent epimerase/dehydratase family protein [Bacillus sp. V5-8f]
MRVLVTGGYGFIGSFVAERFYKEGHDVFIIDNLATGKKENITFKHKGYILDVEDSNCEEIFRASRFDIVVHLAADSPTVHSIDTRREVLGLTNILSLSKKYMVKQVVYASSAEVYGPVNETLLSEESHCDPVTPIGMNKWFGELYISKWSELNGFPVLVYRMSDVYGPKQGVTSEGMIAKFIKSSLNNSELIVAGNGEQTGDYIFVEDVADAIYKGVIHNHSGVYNLSSNQDISMNELNKTLQPTCSVPGITYAQKENGNPVHSSLDNSKLQKDFDWFPPTSLKEGLEKTYDWYWITAQAASTLPNEHKESKLASMLTKLFSKVEIVALFAFMFTLSALFQQKIEVLDFKLLFIVLGTVLLGRERSIPTIGIGVLWYIVENLMQGREIVSLLYHNNTIAVIAVYIFVGLTLSYVIDKKNQVIKQAKKDLDASEERYQFMYSVYEDVRTVKEELQHQVLYTENSVGVISDIVKRLDSMEPEDIFVSAVGVIEEVMKTEEVAIYSVNDEQSFLRLVAKSKHPNAYIPSFIDAEAESEFYDLLSSKKLFINSTFNENLPLMMAPVMDGEKVSAVICLYQADFENLTLQYQNLFTTVVGLISSALSRADEYVFATNSERYVEGTNVLNAEFLDRILKVKQQAKETLNMDYTLLNIKFSIHNFSDTINNLQRSLRKTDYIGLNENNELVILLSNTNEDNAEVVKNRLSRNNIFILEQTNSNAVLA